MLEVGQIVKPHGLKGEVIVRMITNRPEERVAPGFVFSTDRGDLTLLCGHAPPGPVDRRLRGRR